MTHAPSVRFYYDFVCPWAYLASLEVERAVGSVGAKLEWRPILLGGVFRAIGGADQPALAMPASKLRYSEADLLRWADRLGVSLRRPESHPRRTVLALRATLASGDVVRASQALFAAYWRDGRDLEDPAVVAGALDAAGLDGARAVQRADEHKDELRTRTEEAVSEGLFGVPSFVVDGPAGASLHWGIDRLEQVQRALRPRKQVVFTFDYASPYAYLGATQIRRIAARAGADLVLRPVLLGALFRSVGTPDVPLFAMPEPKQRYQASELERWARLSGVRFRFNSRFPVRTVDALRLTLLAPEDRRADLMDAIFAASWADDRDITSRDELGAIASAVGIDPAIVAQLDEPEAKLELRRNNEEAERLGIFGVPSFEVDGTLYWGQDRLDWVERALSGESAATRESSAPKG
jgi:2-hydroxychromene-2-carboxylate isomerase